MIYFLKSWLFAIALVTTNSTSAITALTENHQKLFQAAEELFARNDISYVYGGSEPGSVVDCSQCIPCLEEQKPKPEERIKACPVCVNCSLDCSHFTYLVFKKAGFFSSYLNTQMMINLSPQKLTRDYRLFVIGDTLEKAKPGDLLVYSGHVVILLSEISDNRGDIIHSTGGRDIKGPGQAIQKERGVFLNNFRGAPLLRILRHTALIQGKGAGKKSHLRPIKPIPKPQ